jgi:hypothetical protein
VLLDTPNSVAYLAKFDPNGELKWATYYGGDSGSGGSDLVILGSGDIYLTGGTNSTSHISTPCAYQTSYAGGDNLGGDGFLAQFDSTGFLKWATYFGGSNEDLSNGIATDGLGSIYICGSTQSTSNISTVNSYQPYLDGGYWDAFLAKFTVAALPFPSAIFGPQITCVGTGVILSDSVSGGYWSSSDTAIASIDTNGKVTAISGGIINIFYNFINSCDSNVTLPFTVYSVYRDTINRTICSGDTFYIGLHAHFIAGSSTDTLSSISGCDSIISLHLSINRGYFDTIFAEICEGDTFYLGSHSHFMSSNTSVR